MLSDGKRHLLPILPRGGRFHATQKKYIAEMKEQHEKRNYHKRNL